MRMRCLPPDVEVRVVAPTPGFPFVAGLRPGYRRRCRAGGPGRETVLHPRFLSFRASSKPGRASFSRCALPAVLAPARTFRFDAIDAHFVYPGGHGGVLLGRFFRTPVLVTLRGHAADPRHLRAAAAADPLDAPRAARVIAVSARSPTTRGPRGPATGAGCG